MAEAAVASDGYRLNRVASYDAWDANMIYVSGWLVLGIWVSTGYSRICRKSEQRWRAEFVGHVKLFFTAKTFILIPSTLYPKTHVQF